MSDSNLEYEQAKVVDIIHICPMNLRSISGLMGTHIGLRVQDLGGTCKHADFDYFCIEKESMQLVY